MRQKEKMKKWKITILLLMSFSVASNGTLPTNTVLFFCCILIYFGNLVSKKIVNRMEWWEGRERGSMGDEKEEKERREIYVCVIRKGGEKDGLYGCIVKMNKSEKDVYHTLKRLWFSNSIINNRIQFMSFILLQS